MTETLYGTAVSYLRELFAGDSGGHGLDHTLRVYRTALAICGAEGGDEDIVSLAALLHDADDPKLFSTEDLANARGFLRSNGLSPLEGPVCDVIRTVSFRSDDTVAPDTLEGKIVQDADRLDAMGAIGIARTFAYGGSHGRPIYDPEHPPRPHVSEAEYRNQKGSSLNHFYEKLLLLKDLMNTETGRRMAERRHAFLEDYLKEFFLEWEGK